MKRKSTKVLKKVVKIKRFKFKLILLFFLIIIGGIIISVILSNKNYDDRVKAEDLGQYCDTPPDCCAEIEKTGDPFGCDWPWRKYCKPGQCNIPEGVNRQRCGVAYKEVWPWGCVCKPSPGVSVTNPPEPIIWDGFQNGCPISNPTQVPTSPPTSIPTIPSPTVFVSSTPIPVPTDYPTATPYPTNDVNPTSIVLPTRYNPPTIIIYPTITPLPTFTPTPTPRPFSLPNILPPKEEVENFIQVVKKAVTDFMTSVLP